MKIKVYRKGKWRGDTTITDNDILIQDKIYSGTFLVFQLEDEIGCVLFSIHKDDLVAQSQPWLWDFNEKNRIS